MPGSSNDTIACVFLIDLPYIEEHTASTITPIVFTNLADNEHVVVENDRVEIQS